MKLPMIGALCASLCLPVLAAEGKWTEGFGQGNLEYFIDQQGVRLYIGCPTEDGSAGAPSSVSLSQVRIPRKVATRSTAKWPPSPRQTRPLIPCHGGQSERSDAGV